MPNVAQNSRNNRKVSRPYNGPAIEGLTDLELIVLWFDLDWHMEAHVISDIYVQMCMRDIPRTIDGPRCNDIADRIVLAISGRELLD